MTIRARFMLLLSILIITLMLVVLTVLRYRISVSAMEQATSDMVHSRANFESYFRQNNHTLLSQCSLIGEIPVLAANIDTHDHMTVLDAAGKYKSKIGVDAVVVTDNQGILLARTDLPDLWNVNYSSLPFVKSALRGQPWIGNSVDNHKIYQIVCVPVVINREVLGSFTALYALSDQVACSMQSRTGVDLSFIAGDRVTASSLLPGSRSFLERLLRERTRVRELVFRGVPVAVSLGGARWLLSAAPMAGQKESAVYYVLQESLDKAMIRFYQLQNWIIAIGIVSLLVGIAASSWISRRITHPVSEMVKAVRSIEAGQWDHQVEVSTNDEFQVLAQSFNGMTERLRRHMFQQQCLQVFLQDMLTLKEVDQILDKTVSTVVHATSFDGAAIYSPREESGELLLSASCRRSEGDEALTATLRNRQQMIADCFAGNAVVMDGNSNSAGERGADAAGNNTQAGTCAAVPLSVESHVLGVLLVCAGTSAAVEEEMLQLSRIIGDTAAIAIARVHLFDAVLNAKVQWETTFDAVELPLILRDSNGTIFRFNRAAADYFGIRPEDMQDRRLSTPCRGCVPSETCVARKCWQTGMHNHAEFTDPTTGRIFAIHAFPIPASYGRIEAVLEYIVDITAEKEESEHMLKLERLRALGEIASGVAHDFNNVLTSISGFAQLLSITVKEPESLEMVKFIEQSAGDAGEIVKRMQTFYKTQTDHSIEAIDINQLLRDVLALTQPRWKDAADASGFPVEMQTDFSDIPPVRGISSEIREVFMNLIFNALDAMPQGGTLRLTTQKEDHHVVITVSDTGMGMTPEVRARVFESFFTTKGIKGTGLGLSLTHRIVATHGGEISVDSVPGEGTTFTVKLPAGLEDEGQEQPSEEPAQAHHLHILVVDDDAKVRLVVRSMLQQDGHTVSEASSGLDALGMFRDDHFDVVITDLGMPAMNGRQVARRMHMEDAAIPIIMMTGWSDQLDEDELQQDGIAVLIGKPVKIEALRDAVDRVGGQLQI